MIVEHSDEPPLRTLLKRFPVPANFKVAPAAERPDAGSDWPGVRTYVPQVHRPGRPSASVKVAAMRKSISDSR
jgi:hypothetical protein